MPLILFVGYPSSGKSSWASKLVKRLEDRISSVQPTEPGANMKVILHSDETLGIAHEMYRESASEKAARGEQMSAVRRDLSKNNIVILDGLNYIKGFRYQLFCESKNLGTTYCVIQVIAPNQVCFDWNSSRPEGCRWDTDLLNALIMRFEEPDGRNRWDSPLIPISYDDKELPFDDIWRSIVLKKPPKPNHSTFMQPASAANYLQELDRLTSEVVDQIIEYQNLNQVGGYVVIKSKASNNLPIHIDLPPRTVSLAQLQRLRRTYVSLNRMRSLDSNRIIPLFAQFLDNALNSE
ncbi:DEKNAAC101964 [Brettanomyces naardenensis]|uniref:DEKNAAC101964 n=1 Tax=Brettanomyces naardenensis TaxID=13370 RepID=A0A448YJP8_BRENA|nr:DEKNAAC101964 [Brettanomyces naardenensis]